MRTGIARSRRRPVGRITAIAVKTSMASGRQRMASTAILTSLASIFLPRYSGVRPTIRPAMKIGEDDEHQDAVEAGADAADDDLAELHVDQRDQAAERA